MEKHLVTILTTHLNHQIHIAKSKLEEAGIESYFLDEHIDSNIGTAFVQGYKLQVDVAHEKKALETLAYRNNE
ncbi:MAG: hypothetical protein COB98_11885 [Flavobacteriaceae bacterium]|nr:MAG: hypothetical protein COB98_11885 [Flavobacteriaceae bacterium]